MTGKQAATRFTIGAAAGCLLLASVAGAQQYGDTQQGAASGYETLGGQQAQGLPDVSGIQQKMQEQMMQQMTQQMQAASPAAQMQGAAAQAAPPAVGQAQGMPDVSGIQQKMQEQMMQQMTQQMQAASPAAQMQGAAAPQVRQQQFLPLPGNPSSMQDNLRQQMQNVLGVNPSAPQSNQPGGFHLDAAVSSLKIDPAVQSSLNQKMQKIMEQTMKETFSNAKTMQGARPQQFGLPANP